MHGILWKTNIICSICNNYALNSSYFKYFIAAKNFSVLDISCDIKGSDPLFSATGLIFIIYFVIQS